MTGLDLVENATKVADTKRGRFMKKLSSAIIVCVFLYLFINFIFSLGVIYGTGKQSWIDAKNAGSVNIYAPCGLKRI